MQSAGWPLCAHQEEVEEATDAVVIRDGVRKPRELPAHCKVAVEGRGHLVLLLLLLPLAAAAAHPVQWVWARVRVDVALLRSSAREERVHFGVRFLQELRKEPKRRHHRV